MGAKNFECQYEAAKTLTPNVVIQYYEQIILSPSIIICLSLIHKWLLEWLELLAIKNRDPKHYL